MTEGGGREAIPPDYDENPERFKQARAVLRDHALAADVHERVARRLVREGLVPVLDVGCGDGELARHLPDGVWTGVDSSAEMLAHAPSPTVRADARALPFPDESFGSVALLYVLYHLPDPGAALTEARRVLRGGGVVAVAVPSSQDSPELGDALPDRALTVDAELAPALLERFFDQVEVERWDAPLLKLPDRDAVRAYLVGKGVPEREAVRAGGSVAVPMTVTKRGALLYGRKA